MSIAMAKEEISKSIYEDLESRGIDKNYFNRLYNSIITEKKIIPARQYNLILKYLREQKVLNGNKIDEKALDLFNSRLNLEQKLKNDDQFQDIEKNSGGVMPCRQKDRLPISRGGMMPCRQEDD